MEGHHVNLFFLRIPMFDEQVVQNVSTCMTSIFNMFKNSVLQFISYRLWTALGIRTFHGLIYHRMTSNCIQGKEPVLWMYFVPGWLWGLCCQRAEMVREQGFEDFDSIPNILLVSAIFFFAASGKKKFGNRMFNLAVQFHPSYWIPILCHVFLCIKRKLYYLFFCS